MKLRSAVALLLAGAMLPGAAGAAVCKIGLIADLKVTMQGTTPLVPRRCVRVNEDLGLTVWV